MIQTEVNATVGSQEVTRLDAGTLVVCYMRAADRLSHTIGYQRKDRFVPILESIEGTADQAWPPSPPMQQMVREEIGANRAAVLLGVGLSGNGHWSCAVESEQTPALKFDIACKNSKPSGHFGSKYRIVAGEFAINEPHPITLHLNHGDGSQSTSIAIQLHPVIGTIELNAIDRTLSIHPLSDPAIPATHRWCFKVALVSRGNCD
jgi:hypothetical protein